MSFPPIPPSLPDVTTLPPISENRNPPDSGVPNILFNRPPLQISDVNLPPLSAPNPPSRMSYGAALGLRSFSPQNQSPSPRPPEFVPRNRLLGHHTNSTPSLSTAAGPSPSPSPRPDFGQSVWNGNHSRLNSRSPSFTESPRVFSYNSPSSPSPTQSDSQNVLRRSFDRQSSSSPSLGRSSAASSYAPSRSPSPGLSSMSSHLVRQVSSSPSPAIPENMPQNFPPSTSNWTATASPSGDEFRFARRLNNSTEKKGANELGSDNEEILRSSPASTTDRSSNSSSSASGSSIGSRRLSAPSLHRRVQQLNPTALRWSQSQVSCCLADKTLSVFRLANIMKKYGWKPDAPPLLAVRMPDGSLVSSDNRRLTAARIVVMDKPDFQVPVEIYEWDEMTGRSLNSFINRSLGDIGDDELDALLSKVSELDPKYKKLDQAEASYGDTILIKMYGKTPYGVEAQFRRGGFGYEAFPQITRIFDIAPRTATHDEHVVKLDRAIKQVAERVFESKVAKGQENPPLSEPDELTPAQKRQLRRAKKRAERASSVDSGQNQNPPANPPILPSHSKSPSAKTFR